MVGRCGGDVMGQVGHRETEVRRKGVGNAGPLGAHAAGRHRHLSKCTCCVIYAFADVM